MFFNVRMESARVDLFRAPSGCEMCGSHRDCDVFACGCATNEHSRRSLCSRCCGPSKKFCTLCRRSFSSLCTIDPEVICAQCSRHCCNDCEQAHDCTPLQEGLRKVIFGVLANVEDNLGRLNASDFGQNGVNNVTLKALFISALSVNPNMRDWQVRSELEVREDNAFHLCDLVLFNASLRVAVVVEMRHISVSSLSAFSRFRTLTGPDLRDALTRQCEELSKVAREELLRVSCWHSELLKDVTLAHYMGEALMTCCRNGRLMKPKVDDYNIFGLAIVGVANRLVPRMVSSFLKPRTAQCLTYLTDMNQKMPSCKHGLMSLRVNKRSNKWYWDCVQTIKELNNGRHDPNKKGKCSKIDIKLKYGQFFEKK